MRDVFNLTNQKFGGAFPVDGASITFSGMNGELMGTGMLVRQMNYNYAQPVTIMFELGSNNAYAIAGRARGNSSIQRMVGPRSLTFAFYTQYGNICNMGSNNIVMGVQPGTCSTGLDPTGGSITMNYVYLGNVGGSINSDEPLLSENLALTFLTLDILPVGGVKVGS